MSITQANAPSGISKYLPILQWLPGYPSGWLRKDVVAGLTTAAVVIPQAMAYATIAGLPVEVGLYTAMVLMVVYAILGTSRVLMVSVTSTISILTAATLLPVIQGSDPDLYLTAATTLAVLVGRGARRSGQTDSAMACSRPLISSACASSERLSSSTRRYSSSSARCTFSTA